MKRDFELIRKILMKIEECDEIFGLRQIEVDGHTEDEVMYNTFLLYDAGLIDGIVSNTIGKKQIINLNLNWSGHEFLDNARDDTVWNKTQEIIKNKVGSVGIDLLTSILLKQSERILGVL